MKGFSAFLIILGGQFLSILGSGMTTFALTIWAWQETGQALSLALIAFFAFSPAIVLGPLIGVLIDRWKRKSLLILSDLAASLSSVLLLILYLTGQLEMWHLYVVSLWNGIFNALQLPTFSAAITTLIPKERYTRANGLRSIISSLSIILAPAMAGVLLSISSLGLILWIDIITFCIASVALLVVSIPQPPKSIKTPKNFVSEVTLGFKYLLERKGLFGLLLSFTAFNFVVMVGIILLSPMVLARTGNNELALGTLRGAVGLGGILGGIFVSLWSGLSQRKVHGILLALTLGSLSLTGLGLGSHLLVWIVTAFLASFFLPIADALFGAINQAKIPPEIQGKVFASSRMISNTATPLAMILSGLLADRVFEPAMRFGGAWANTFVWLVGTGPGSGMALLLIASGLFGTIVSTVAFLYRPLRNLEIDIPDHDFPKDNLAQARAN